MPLKLYKLDASPPARAAMMVTEFINAQVEMVDVDLIGKKEHLEPSYLKKNPLHSIPVLEDGNLTLIDSHAIIAYLIDVYGRDETLYPRDPKYRALVNEKLFFDTAILFPRLRSITYAAAFEGLKKPSHKQMTDISEAYEFLEEFLSRTKWLAGDHMTIADISAIATVSSLHYLVPIVQAKYPKIKAWCGEMEKKDFYQKYNAAGAEMLGTIVKEKLSL